MDQRNELLSKAYREKLDWELWAKNLNDSELRVELDTDSHTIFDSEIPRMNAVVKEVRYRLDNR